MPSHLFEPLEPRQVLASDLIISEFMAANSNGLQDKDGEYSDWIEIHNTSASAKSLDGWFLTDSAGTLNKWQFPNVTIGANGYLVVFASDKNLATAGSELHTNFKLSASGEFLALVEADGTTIASQYAPTFPPQSDNISYGIVSGGEYFFSTPTPGAANVATSVSPVSFSITSQTFTNSVSVALSTSTSGAAIRYTTNGTEPTASSTLYVNPITVSNTTIIRARAFKTGLAASPTVSHTYTKLASDVQSWSSDLPVLVINSFGTGFNDASYTRVFAHLYDKADGRNNLTDAPSLDTRAGVKIRGSSSQSFPKKSYNFETWGEVDEQSRGVSVLGFSQESDWILYAPYTDKSLMRDVLAYQLSNNIGRWAPGTRFVEVFVDTNGGQLSANEYQGVYVFAEKIKIDENRIDIEQLEPTDNTEPDITGGYLLKIDRLDPGNVGFTTTGGTTPEGRTFPRITLGMVDPPETSNTKPPITTAQKNWIRNHFNEFEAALFGANFKDPLNGYAKFIDVDAWIDHHILVETMKNIDGYRLSTFLYKDRGGKIVKGPIWDYNLSAGNADYLEGWKPDSWYWAQPGITGTSAYPWWDRLFEDPNFQQKWIDRWTELRQGPFHIDNILGHVDAWVRELAEAEVRDHKKWPTIGVRIWPNWFIGKTYQEEIDWMKQWLRERVAWIDNQYLKRPSYNQEGGQIPVGFQLTMSSDSGSIYYTLDGSDPRASGGGIAANAIRYTGPVTLDANTRVTARLRNGSRWSAPNEQLFFTANPPLRITEIMYNPAPPPAGSPYTAGDFEYLEVQNVSNEPLNVGNLRFSNGITFDFPNATLAAGERAVIVRNQAAFASRYGSGLAVLGVFTGALDNAGERLRIEEPLGVPAVDFSYENNWYPVTDGGGFSLVVVDPNAPLAQWSDKASWRASQYAGGNPLAADVGYALGAVTVNELLANTTQAIGDWIELKNGTGSAIDIGGWYLSDSAANLLKYQIPFGTTIAAGAYLVINERDHFGGAFGLSSAGETVYLTQADSAGVLMGYREVRSFGGSDPEVTFGEYVKSSGGSDFVALVAGTAGADNAAPSVGPVIISEVMYNPSGNGDEFIELRNISGTAVPLYDPARPANTWRFSDGIDFVFPTGVSIQPDSYALIVNIDPATFRTKYNVPANVPVMGPYAGFLDNAGEKLELLRPGVPLGDGTVPQIRADYLNYNNKAPWPTQADGTGVSLSRLVSTDYGNDSANWEEGAPNGTPGRPGGSFALEVADVSIEEGDSGTKNLTFTVTLSNARGVEVTVAYTTTAGTASSTADYVSQSGVLTFAPDVVSQTVTVEVKGDATDEADETFFLDLSDAVNASIRRSRATATIVDNDPEPTISISDPTITERDGLITNAIFTVSLASGSSQVITVAYTTANGTAEASKDYFAKSGTVTFNPGITTQTIIISTIGDLLDEDNETFFVDLSNAGNSVISKSRGTATIADNDPEPSLSISDLTIVEGTGGTVDAIFTVALSAASGREVLVDYATANGTAQSGSDYESQSGVVTFAVGETSRTITVPIISDSSDESDETFVINLTNPVNATLADGQAQGTITDDDEAGAAPVVSNTGDSGAGSLREAILAANASGSTPTITFDLTGAGPHVIQLSSALPALTQPTNIEVADGVTLEIGTANSFSLGGYTQLTKTGLGKLVLGGNFASSSAATLTAAAGVLDLMGDAGSMTTVVANAAVNFHATQHLASLVIGDSVTAVVAPGGDNILVTSNLNIAGTGKLDLTDNAAIVQATPETRAAVLTSVAGWVAQGANNFQWNGNGIASSAAASDTTLLTAIGLMLNDDGLGNPLHPTFAGQPADANAVLVKFTYYGDADLTGTVDGTDYALIDNGYNTGATDWFNGDFSHNQVVDGDDYALIDNAFNAQGAPLTASIFPVSTNSESQSFGGSSAAATSGSSADSSEARAAALAADDWMVEELLESEVDLLTADRSVDDLADSVDGALLDLLSSDL